MKICSFELLFLSSSLVLQYFMTITSYTPSNVETTTQPWASAGGGAKRAFAPLEIETKKQKFVENLKAAV